MSQLACPIANAHDPQKAVGICNMLNMLQKNCRVSWFLSIVKLSAMSLVKCLFLVYPEEPLFFQSPHYFPVVLVQFLGGWRPTPGFSVTDHRALLTILMIPMCDCGACSGLGCPGSKTSPRAPFHAVTSLRSLP